MNEESELPAPLERFPTGITGMDAILNGGLFKAGIYIAMGSPGAGKTIFANQVCSHHVKHGGRALYVTLLAETHARMLAQMRSLTFFDESAVGKTLKYVNGFNAMESEGLEGLLKLLRGAVREHQASLLVLDGVVTAGMLAKSSIDYKKFINELQTWIGFIGCTVLFLTSAATESGTQPEHTMVDGIFELRTLRKDLQSVRLLSVTKFRGSAFTEGSHPYFITGDGLRVFPRVEGHYHPRSVIKRDGHRVAFGIPRLDALLEGGLARWSTTLLLGSSGAGKTVLGMHYLCGGAEQGEPGVHFGFYENPRDLLAKADRMGLKFSEHVRNKRLAIFWEKPAERVLDALADQLLETVRTYRAKRVFIDGLVGFKAATFPDRVSGFFSVLVEELAAQGVTTVITEETQQLFVRNIEVPTSGVSAIFHNILFLRQVERGAALARLLSIIKTRDSGQDHNLYEFDITDEGFKLGGPFNDSRALTTGITDAPRARPGGKRPKKRGKR